MLMRSDYKCPVQICISNVAKSSSVEDLNQNLVLFSFGCIYSISIDPSNNFCTELPQFLVHT